MIYYLRNEFHFSEVYRSVNYWVACKVNESRRKIKFVAYIYIHFHHKVDEKSDIAQKLKHENIYTQLQQRNSVNDIMMLPTSSQIV